MRYLASRDRTIAQVEQFLRAKGASTTQVKDTINRLIHFHYLDDRAYAEQWVERRLSGRPMGRERLKAELQTKGIAEAVAESVIREVLRGVDEETLARRALTARQRGGRRITAGQALRFLRQRGFEEETIDHMMGTFLEREGCGI